MIKIELTNKLVENENGQNYYWKGLPGDYLNLVNDLHLLGEKNENEIIIDEIGYIIKPKNISIVFRSRLDGNKITEIRDNLIITELDTKDWREVLNRILSVSFIPAHNFIEFSNSNMIEEANFIISSELLSN